MKQLFAFSLLLALIVPGIVGAISLNLEYPKFGNVDLSTDQGLEDLISWLYYAIIGISTIAAFIMLIWGGIEWMTSSGNPTKTGDARDRIKAALLGLLLVLSSFIIIQIINPELTILKDPLSGTSTAPGSGPGSSPATSAPSAGSGPSAVVFQVKHRDDQSHQWRDSGVFDCCGSGRSLPGPELSFRWDVPGAASCDRKDRLDDASEGIIGRNTTNTKVEELRLTLPAEAGRYEYTLECTGFAPATIVITKI